MEKDCICCLSKENLHNIRDKHTTSAGDQSCVEMFLDCFNTNIIELMQEDFLHMCSPCIYKLQDAHNFKLQAFETFETLKKRRILLSEQREPELINHDIAQRGTELTDHDMTTLELNITEIKIEIDINSHSDLEDNVILNENWEKEDTSCKVEPLGSDSESDANKPLIETKSKKDKLHKKKRKLAYPYKISKKLKCKICREKMPSITKFHEHMNAHYPNYKCEKCGKGFIHKMRLKSHLKMHVLGEFPCPICGFVCRNDNILRAHKHRLHSGKVMKREDIENTLKRQESKINNEMNYKFSCEECGKKCSNKERLREHREMHIHGNFPCPQCSMVFRNRNILRNHKYRTHGKGAAARRKLLNTHKTKIVNNEHGDLKFQPNTPCATCGKSITDFNSFHCHMSSHYQYLFCNLCGDGFKKRRSLKSHLKHHQKSNLAINEYSSEMSNVMATLKEMRDDNTSRNATELDLLQNYNPYQDYFYNEESKSEDSLLKLLGEEPRTLEPEIVDYKVDENLICQLCEEKLPSVSIFHRHMNEHYPNFRCQECNKPFITRERLAFHMKMHDQGQFECSVCSKVFKNKNILRNHKYKTHGKGAPGGGTTTEDKQEPTIEVQPLVADIPLQPLDPSLVAALEGVDHYVVDSSLTCKVCGEKQSGVRSFHRHMNEHFPNFICRECGKPFINKERLSNHMQMHIRGQFPCNFCNHIFHNLNVLRMHKYKTHGNGALGAKRVRRTKAGERVIVTSKGTKRRKHPLLPYTVDESSLDCKLCGEVMTSVQLFHQHMNIHYPNYVCEVCGKGLLSAERLYSHRLTHMAGEYTCEPCGKIFRSIHGYNSHKRVHHGVGKVNRCPQCGERFSTYQQRLKHLASVHGDHDIANKFKCKYCSKAFMVSSLLNIHTRRVHQKDSHYACNICNRTFFLRKDYQTHMSHFHDIGDHYVRCQHCLKSFASTKSLGEHTKIHNKDKRYSCEVCGKSFIQKGALTGHMRTHVVKKTDSVLVGAFLGINNEHSVSVGTLNQV